MQAHLPCWPRIDRVAQVSGAVYDGGEWKHPFPPTTTMKRIGMASFRLPVVVGYLRGPEWLERQIEMAVKSSRTQGPGASSRRTNGPDGTAQECTTEVLNVVLQ